MKWKLPENADSINVIFSILMIEYVIIFILFSFIVLPVKAETGSTTYTTYMDSKFGFYKVRDITSNSIFSYDEHTLTINQGDTMIWKNDDDRDKAISIVSDEKLWSDNIGHLGRYNAEFKYTFTAPGEYTFRISQFQGQQIIIVRSSPQTFTPVPTNPVPTTYPAITQTPTSGTGLPDIPIKITPITMLSALISLIAMHITTKQ
ncbi:MAG: hypothetical protein C3F06_10595 [Candidatus Methanoperedenaceae archaeon]|nr:MAG: hypothetical protein C3F06_10595 [Candidatus Methanoperedenaceae archaeon]